MKETKAPTKSTTWSAIGMILIICIGIFVLAYLSIPSGTNQIAEPISPINTLEEVEGELPRLETLQGPVVGIDGELVPEHWSRAEMSILCNDPSLPNAPVELKSTEPFSLNVYLDYKIEQGNSIAEMSYPHLVAGPCVEKFFAYSWMAHEAMPFAGEVTEKFRVRIIPSPITATILISSTDEAWNSNEQGVYIGQPGNYAYASDWVDTRTFLWSGEPEYYYVYLPIIYSW